jgi:hypothetical protein
MRMLSATDYVIIIFIILLFIVSGLLLSWNYQNVNESMTNTVKINMNHNVMRYV